MAGLLKAANGAGLVLALYLSKLDSVANQQTSSFSPQMDTEYPYAFSDTTPKDVIIAYELDGSPLPEVLRLVVPNANGESWISMITSISINNPIYPISPNPAAASIVYEKPLLQKSPTLQPTPTPQPTDPPITQPTDSNANTD